MKPKFLHAFLVLWIIISSFVSGISSAQVTAQFTAELKAGCAPLFVTFVNTSTGTGTLTYTWDFGNGNSSNLQSPSQTYNTCGNYVVTLTVSNGTSTATDTAHITVYCKPTSSFTYDNASGCPGTCVNFTNTSTAGSGTITSTFWDFGDGNTSAVNTPTHCYSSSGSFNVTLTVTNSFGCTNSKVIANAITINAPPVANFSGLPVLECKVPATINFTNSSTGTATLTYNWNFGDPSSGSLDTSSLANPNHTYNALGNYNVTLIVTDGNGCMDTLTIPNYIKIGNFTTTVTSSTNAGCCPLIVNFNEVSEGNPTGYTWTFGGGIPNSTLSNPQITFPCPAGNVPVVYNVKLTETFAAGCIATDSTTITVSNKPTAGFTSSGTLTTCVPPDAVVFNNTSTGAAGTTYQWFFGDGTSSTSTNPSHTYTTCGSFNVMLIATNTFGCADTFTSASFVNITCPVATFTATPMGGCIPQLISFNSAASTGNPISWSWNFGDPGSGAANTSNLQNPSHTYTQAGCYTVSLITTNALGCSDTTAKADAVCLGNPPTPNFSANPRAACAFQSFSFTDSTTGLDSLSTFFWEFGDGGTSTLPDPSHIYSDTGVFSVTLVVCNAGCCDSITFANYIHIYPPIASIAVSIDCQDAYNVCFDGSKSIGANTYDWNFGDPGSGALDSSTLVTPCHLYAASGSYTVSLTVYNDSTGCSFTQTTTINARHVIAAFKILPATGCVPLNLVTVNNSTDASSYQWTVTDSATNMVVFTSTSSAPTFIFASSGVYVFQLVAVDTNGCSDTSVTIFNLGSSFVTANFAGNPLSGCAPLDVQFTDSSTSSGGPIKSWSWNFGDSYNASTLDTSSLQNPQHIYTKTGDYSITLTVTDSFGCSQTLIRSNYVVVGTPNTAFTASDTMGCVNGPICFTGLPSNNGDTYDWNFGDPGSGVNDSSTLENPCHSFSGTGTYAVSLKVTSPTGCDSILTKTNYITIISPVANFKASGATSSICPPLLVNFVDSSYSNITSWQWNFGDGNTSTDQDPSHVYSISGSYTVTLVVTNAMGCTDTLVKTNYVIVQGPNGTFVFTPDSGCSPLYVCFKATTTTTTNLTYIWNYGNTTSGPIPGGDSICYTYSLPGVYYPSLILQDSAGCIFSVNSPDSVWVHGPEAKFVVDDNPRCGPGPIQFTDSTKAVAVIASWSWNFGDPASGASDTSTLQDPMHIYNSIGQYIVTEAVTTVDGCVGTFLDTLTVLPAPIALFDVLNSPVCPGGIISFNDSSTSIHPIKSWAWNFGDTASANLDTSTSKNTSHQYKTPGKYTVKLLIVDSLGCKDSITSMVTVNPLPNVNVSPNEKICLGSSTNLDASGGINYLWTPSAGLSNDSIFDPAASPTVTTTYSVLVTDSNGCKNTDSLIITVDSAAIDSVSPAQKICFGFSTTLFANGGISYNWSPNVALSNDTIDNPVANPSTTTTYTVTITNLNGCVSNYLVVVNVNPPPPANAGPDQNICIGSSTKLNGSGGLTYAWLSNPSGFSSDSSSPMVSPTVTTQYTVTVTDTNGCVASDSTSVIVHSLPTVSVSGDSSLCFGASTTLNASGGVNYLWMPSAGLSNTGIYDPVANPVATTTYTVLVTDANGCENKDSLVITVNPLPVDSVSPTQKVCYGLSTTLFASGGISYNWSPNAELSDDSISDPVANPTSNTTYTVTVTSSNGCKSNDSVEIEVNPAPPANAGPDQSICIGSSAKLNGSGGIDYAWTSNPSGFSSDSSSPVTSPTVTTQYTVSVTDTNGCVASDTTTVIVHPLPTVSINGSDSICFGASTTLDAAGGVNYLWTPSTGLSNTGIYDPTASPTTTTTYNVAVTDANGCKNIDSLVITVNPLPVDSVSPSQKICYGLSTTLFASGGINYNWSPNIGLSNTGISNPVANPTTNITYTVTVTNSNGCMSSDSVEVKVNPPPPANAGPDQNICIGASATLNGNGGVGYSWSSNPTGFSSDSSSPVVSPTVTTQYTVTVTDTNGCIATDTTTVIVHPLPIANIQGGGPLCLGSSIQLTASGGSTYVWSPTSGLNNPGISNPEVYPFLDTTTYFVTVTNSFGCSAKDSITVDVIFPFRAKVGSTDTICAGSSVQLSASGGVLYSWTPTNSLNNATIDDPIASPTISTLYTVIISDSICFSDTENVYVYVYPNPSFSAGQNQTIVLGNSIVLGQLTPPYSGTFTWTPQRTLSCDDCQNPTATPDSTTTYYVTLVNQYGCRTTDSVVITIKIICAEDLLFVPNAFTPNGDGLDDIFYVRARGIQQLNYFRVFDRWGELLFESNDLSVGWDGTYKGKKLPPAVYVYDVSAICSSGETIYKKGNVTLIR